MHENEKAFSAIIAALITPDKILISIHRIARIIWRIKILRRTGTNMIQTKSVKICVLASSGNDLPEMKTSREINVFDF